MNPRCQVASYAAFALISAFAGCSFHPAPGTRWAPLAGPRLPLPFTLPDGAALVDYSFGDLEHGQIQEVTLSFTEPRHSRPVRKVALRQGSSFRGFVLRRIAARAVTIGDPREALAGTGAHEAFFDSIDTADGFILEELAHAKSVIRSHAP